jgi:hypothetical protein
VAGFLADHGKDKQSQITVIERPTAATAAERMPAMTMMGASVMAVLRIFRAGETAAIAAYVIFEHNYDITHDITNIKIYLD